MLSLAVGHKSLRFLPGSPRLGLILAAVTFTRETLDWSEARCQSTKGKENHRLFLALCSCLMGFDVGRGFVAENH